jgi:peptidoglycan/LPS O-acetylase OafA/YrhL
MKKLESIDLVRSFAVLSVLGCHWAGTHLVSAEGLPPWLQWAWSKVAYNGALGVPAFFLVSGFLITRLLAQSPGGLDKPNLRFFYSRRVGRIVPLYVLTLLVCMLLLFVVPPLDPSSFKANLQISHDPLEPLFWISLMTFTLNWFTTFFSAQHPFGGAWGILWSICIEEQFYLFIPSCSGS